LLEWLPVLGQMASRDNGTPLLGQRPGHGFTQAPAAPRDQGHSPVQ
jgi:hypothetical protein